MEDDWAWTQATRRLRLADHCKRHPVRPCTANYILTDDRNQILYCFVPKVGCSTWKTLLLKMRLGETSNSNMSMAAFANEDIHSMTFMKEHGIEQLSALKPAEQTRRVKKFKKFLFVRDPFERIVSAYRDKFESGTNEVFNQMHGRRIIQQYRRKPSKEALEKGNDVKFGEFVRFVVDGNSEPHWSTFQEQCCPCHIAYDAVGKMETFREDTLQILRRFYNRTLSEALANVPSLNVNTKGQTNREDVAEHLRRLSPSEHSALNLYLQDDCDMFGFQTMSDPREEWPSL
jgi:hypothetical protein